MKHFHFFRYFIFFCLLVVAWSTVPTLDAFPFGKKKDQSSEEQKEKKEKKGGFGAMLGGVVDTAKNVGSGAGTVVTSKLPGNEDAGKKKVQKIISTTYDEIEASRQQLEADYDALRADFVRIVGIVEDESAFSPEDSLIYEVQRFDAALEALNVPSVEAVQSKIGIGMDSFLDNSGAVDHAKYASTSEILSGQIGPRAKQLRALLTAELETEDKRRVVQSFDAFSTAINRTINAQSAFIREAQALEQKAFEEKEAAKANFRKSFGQMTGIIAMETFVGKQAMDFADVDSSEREKILVSYLGAEASDDVIAMFKVMNSDSGFWAGLDERADEMEVLSGEINQSVRSIYAEFGSAHAQVSQIAEEVGAETITGYFAEAVQFQSDLATGGVN